MRWIFLLSLFGYLSARADVTGRWMGSARVNEGGTPKQVPISITLAQHGDEVTGSVLVEEKDSPIASGRNEEGRRVRFRVSLANEEVQFDLTINGDRMAGKATSTKGADGVVVEVELTRKVLARPVTDTSGVWSGTLSGKGESLPIRIEFHQSGNAVIGVATAKDKDAPLKGEIDGAKLTFQADTGGEKVRFALIVTAENMSGFAALAGGGKEAVLDVELTRTAKAAATRTGVVSGQWAGTLDIEEQGTVKHYPIRFRLAQSGNALTGSLVNEDGAEFPIQTGSVRGNHVEFEMDAKSEHVRFRLSIDGDRLTGESIQSRGGSQTSARISAVRRIE
jgi:hypothetical protein